MTKAPLYNAQGDLTGTVDLADSVFGVKPKKSVVHQVYVALMANARQPWADTKNRGEVRGGGKKPWAQKGTGRARHGSSRSPIWKGGGVTFGPLSIRNYKQKINKKMNQTAVRMCLSDKALSESLMIVDEMLSTNKTKLMDAFRKKMPGAGKSTLLVMDIVDDNTRRSVGNLQNIETCRAADLNVVDLMHHQYLVVSKGGLSVLEKRLA